MLPEYFRICTRFCSGNASPYSEHLHNTEWHGYKRGRAVVEPHICKTKLVRKNVQFRNFLRKRLLNVLKRTLSLGLLLQVENDRKILAKFPALKCLRKGRTISLTSFCGVGREKRAPNPLSEKKAYRASSDNTRPLTVPLTVRPPLDCPVRRPSMHLWMCHFMSLFSVMVCCSLSFPLGCPCVAPRGPGCHCLTLVSGKNSTNLWAG